MGPASSSSEMLMTSRADQLHATVVCLVVRLGAAEIRQKAVMDIDDAALSGSLFWGELNVRGIRALSEHKRYEARADLHVLGVGRSEI